MGKVEGRTNRLRQELETAKPYTQVSKAPTCELQQCVGLYFLAGLKDALQACCTIVAK